MLGSALFGLPHVKCEAMPRMSLCRVNAPDKDGSPNWGNSVRDHRQASSQRNFSAAGDYAKAAQNPSGIEGRTVLAPTRFEKTCVYREGRISPCAMFVPRHILRIWLTAMCGRSAPIGDFIGGRSAYLHRHAAPTTPEDLLHHDAGRADPHDLFLQRVSRIWVL